MVYFIATIYKGRDTDVTEYEEYIERVKPIVERFGGRYLARTDNVTVLSEKWKPDRVILIEWDSREQLERCFSSEEYKAICSKRENSVDSMAIII
ncbi:MAG: DUF1330 domain-containing protein [Lachnospiraceae bacterium]